MAGSQAVGFGFCVPIFSSAGDAHVRTPLFERLDYGVSKAAVLEAERLGYGSVWVADHVILGRGGAILECWSTLSALAAATKRMRLGTIHLCNLFRHPPLVAKMAATLDQVSQGRLDFFVDAGWNKAECLAYGLPWTDSVEERVGRLEEAIQIVKMMWTQPKPSFKGKYYEIKEAICEPKPVQKPHPPIWIGTIGGEGPPYWVEDSRNEGLMMRLTARYADAWNNTPAPVETCKRKLDALKKHCAEVGREYNAITKSLETQVLIAKDRGGVDELLARIRALNPQMRFYAREDLRKVYVVGTPEECAESVRRYVDLGITRFMIWFVDFPSTDGMRLFAETVSPQFK